MVFGEEKMRHPTNAPGPSNHRRRIVQPECFFPHYGQREKSSGEVEHVYFMVVGQHRHEAVGPYGDLLLCMYEKPKAHWAKINLRMSSNWPPGRENGHFVPSTIQTYALGKDPLGYKC